jgi:hypothetical protein
MMKKVIVPFAGPLYFLAALILMGCSSSNAIGFDVDSQCVYPIKGGLKQVDIDSMDGHNVFSFSFESGGTDARKPLPIQNLEPGHIYRISNSGGDRGPFEIYVETDSSGKGIHVMDWDELPAVFSLAQKNLWPVLKQNSITAINGHIDEERARGIRDYPDSVLCAGIWFDFRGESDSLFVLGGPMPLYDDDLDNPFLGYIEGENCLVSFAALGKANPQTINQILDTTALQTNRELYKASVDALITSSHLSGKNVCAWLVSSFSFDEFGGLVLQNRRMQR